MRISDWSSDVCSSDLNRQPEDRHQKGEGVSPVERDLLKRLKPQPECERRAEYGKRHEDKDEFCRPGQRRDILRQHRQKREGCRANERLEAHRHHRVHLSGKALYGDVTSGHATCGESDVGDAERVRSEEHTSELQSLMRISYA